MPAPDLDPLREVVDAVDGHLTIHYTGNAPLPETAWAITLIWADRPELAAGSFYATAASWQEAVSDLLAQMSAAYPTHEPTQEET